MRLVNKIGYLAKKIEEYDEDFYEVRDAHIHNESYIARIDKCYTEFQKALGQKHPQTGGRRRMPKSSRKTRRSTK